jgi:hypothetical protein
MEQKVDVHIEIMARIEDKVDRQLDVFSKRWQSVGWSSVRESVPLGSGG